MCPVNLGIEMETGTGKTYCHIKTMFELNRRYGWGKFIVVVPSIAIREGVTKSFDYTSEDDRIAPAYHAAKQEGTLAELRDALKPHAERFGL